MESYRLFLAIPLPDSIKKLLAHLQEELSSQNWKVRWTSPDTQHLTLHFLGPTPVNLLDDLKHELGACVHQYRPFDLPLDKLGTFPDLRNPKIIWLGLADPHGQLLKIVDHTRRILNAYRLFKLDERNYVPHITLGRVSQLKHWDPRPLEAYFQNYQPNALLAVEKLVLYRSQLSPQGAHHQSLQEYHLLAKP